MKYKCAHCKVSLEINQLHIILIYSTENRLYTSDENNWASVLDNISKLKYHLTKVHGSNIVISRTSNETKEFSSEQQLCINFPQSLYSIISKSVPTKIQFRKTDSEYNIDDDFGDENIFGTSDTFLSKTSLDFN